MEKVLLIGGGAHCASVIDTMNQQAFYEPVGILDIPEKIGKSILGVPIVGTDSDMRKYFKQGIQLVFITLGNTVLRERLAKEAKQIGFEFPIIIDPSSIVSLHTNIGVGSFIGKGAILNNTVVIGEHAIINSGAIIDHDGQIGDYVHVAPGATLSGHVTIGNRTHVGTNATIIQNVEIGEDAMIGAGSVVLKDIASGRKAYGNPCKEVYS
ncbi:MAG TPA: acetyltransferase [Candidatus Jeotgalibaca pullicola]|nr:acetyltransferase [Candidatus Jeotgalibaca pullicola]